MATRKASNRKLTLAIPADLYAKLENIARARRSDPAEVAAGLLQHALGSPGFAHGVGEEHAAAWKRAFAPLTEDEMLLVDGILLSDAGQQ